MGKLRQDVARILGLCVTQWEPPLPLASDLRALRVAATEDAADCEARVRAGDASKLTSVQRRIEQFSTTASEDSVNELVDKVALCMTPAQHEILHLRASTDLSYAEIARRLHMKVKRVARAEVTTLCLAARAIDAE